MRFFSEMAAEPSSIKTRQLKKSLMVHGLTVVDANVSFISVILWGFRLCESICVYFCANCAAFFIHSILSFYSCFNFFCNTVFAITDSVL